MHQKKMCTGSNTRWQDEELTSQKKLDLRELRHTTRFLFVVTVSNGEQSEPLCSFVECRESIAFL